SFDEVINDYEEKIDSLCENYDIDKDISGSSSKNIKVKTYTNIKLIISFIIMFAYILIGSFPVISVIKGTESTLSIIQKSADRIPLLKGIQLYTYEVINQDRSVFLDNEPERILKDMVKNLETIQEELKTGSYGGPTFDSYPELDKVLKENGCFRLQQATGAGTCEDVVYDASYGFTEQLGTLPLDELIRSYLYYVKNFITDVEDERYVRLPFNNKENISIIFHQVLNDDFFKLQEGLMENILGDIQYINYELMDDVIENISNIIDVIVADVIIGFSLFLIITIFVLYSVFKDKIREMHTLISFLFIVPQAIVNKNEKYKRFLETTQTDE
ncbi:hypothetical protein PIROE2DRAFT_15861, partial [Piromyces sp. E2]